MGKAKNPTVSVIIPTYNRAHLIGRAIRSVLNQTYQDFELIVVDDGSTDNTEEVVKGFNDGRIRYIRHDENRGGAAARNTGIKASQGEYIAFLDSDDEWLPHKIEKQLTVFSKGSLRLGVVYTGVRTVDLRSGRLIHIKLPQARGDIFRKLLSENVVVGSTSTALIRRSCLGKSGLFDENLPSRQDLDLWIRLARYYTFDYVREVLAVIYIHKNRITSTPEAKIRGSKLLLQKIYEDLRKSKKLLSQYQFLIGKFSYLAGHRQEGRKYILEAIRTYPFSLKYIIALGATFLGPSLFRWLQHINEVFRLWVNRTVLTEYSDDSRR